MREKEEEEEKRRGGEKRREGKGEKLKSGLPSWNGSLSIIHIERYIRFPFPPLTLSLLLLLYHACMGNLYTVV